MKDIKVENMNCQNCVGKIQRSLLINGIENEIDLPNRTVSVSEDAYQKAVEVIEKAGYKTV